MKHRIVTFWEAFKPEVDQLLNELQPLKTQALTSEAMLLLNSRVDGVVRILDHKANNTRYSLQHYKRTHPSDVSGLTQLNFEIDPTLRAMEKALVQIRQDFKDVRDYSASSVH